MIWDFAILITLTKWYHEHQVALTVYRKLVNHDQTLVNVISLFKLTSNKKCINKILYQLYLKKFEQNIRNYLLGNYSVQKLIIVCIYFLEFANINYSLHLLNIVSYYYL